MKTKEKIIRLLSNGTLHFLNYRVLLRLPNYICNKQVILKLRKLLKKFGNLIWFGNLYVVLYFVLIKNMKIQNRNISL